MSKPSAVIKSFLESATFKCRECGDGVGYIEACCACPQAKGEEV